MDLTGFLVVANLTGCASAVIVNATNACERSIAPPSSKQRTRFALRRQGLRSPHFVKARCAHSISTVCVRASNSASLLILCHQLQGPGGEYPPGPEGVDKVLSTPFESDPLRCTRTSLRGALARGMLGSDSRRIASPLRASAEHFDTCGDRRIFGQK